MSSTAVAAPAPLKSSFDDVMLAMDIVDTLRHRELVLEKELGGAAREEALIRRLKEIYSSQGIEVPDRILQDGVKALAEQRFVYEPPRDGLGVRLARLYIARGRWGPPLLFIAAIALFASAVFEFGFERPREARLERARVELAVTLPESLEEARGRALSLAADDRARSRIETAYAGGIAAIDARDPRRAREAVGELEFLSGVLAQDLTVRIVSRPGEYSGVFRIPDDAPNARNYYLIVEAVDAKGLAHALEIASEEDQKTARAEKWGVRVSEETFNEVAADKADDQIIEHAVIGAKPKGALAPVYEIDAGGAILEW